MGQIVDSKYLAELSRKLKSQKNKIVLAGGCFDILHAGHIEFLKKAKDAGDALVILLESDEKIKELKGKNRPINTQRDRAIALSNLPMVDYVIGLPHLKSDGDYEILVKMLEPDIIAVTAGSKVYDWERVYTNRTGSRIVEVIERLSDYSTSKLADSMKL